MTKLRKIILAGLLVAASIVLGRFLSIRTPIVTIGFSFIPTILSAMLLGPWWTILVSGLSDFLGAIMFPSGPYFVGYTITSLVSGIIYGFILNKTHKKSGKQFIWRLVVACVLVSLICNLGLNTFWIWYTTKGAIVLIAPTRLIKEAILLPIKIVIMQGLHLIFIKTKAYNKLFKNEFEDGEFSENKNTDQQKNEAPKQTDENSEASND